MPHLRAQRPYFEAWLRRTRRQLAPSGRLTEVAVVLSREEGGTEEFWRTRLRLILDQAETPSIELLTKLDGLLAITKPRARTKAVQPMLL